MTRGTHLCWTWAILLGLSGCVAPSPSLSSTETNVLHRTFYQPPPTGVPAGVSVPTPPLRNSAVQGVVYVVDGAGGFEATSQTIRDTVAEVKMPLEVRSFRWTHGYCRILADQIHASHMRRAGQKLADLLLSCQQEAPDRPIYLVGHSAGCGVVLLAAETLPPNTLERIVLLAPAVSSKRDLRGALRSSRQGMDVFISSYDWCCLGLGILLAGTTDRCWLTRAAGKVGFQPCVYGPQDEALYAKLRQYPWDPSLKWTGHKGGHYGSYQPGFLRAFVLPLLTVSP